jgi:hypothetical protein
MNEDITYQFKLTSIETNHIGIEEVLSFYTFSKKYSNKKIVLNLDNLNHFDANLSSLLISICYRLKWENKIYVFIEIPKHLNVLFRNGLLSHLVGNGNDNSKYFDNRLSTITLKSFNIDEEDNFVSYLKSDFLSHRGLDKLSSTTKSNIRSQYIEVFMNALEHANIKYPIFACGQFFPEKNILKFTLVDLGDGFLKKINIKTKGKIDDFKSAILWATTDTNTTRENNIGGTGLKDLKKYCDTNNGSIHICSGDGYVNFIKDKTLEYKLKNFFSGSIINIIFRNI